jgi:hypothetical protein
MNSWADLETNRKPEPTPDQLSVVCARVFNGPDGKELMELLRAMTIDRTLPDSASDNALRALEGQRHLVRRLEIATERGIAAIMKPKAT